MAERPGISKPLMGRGDAAITAENGGLDPADEAPGTAADGFMVADGQPVSYGVTDDGGAAGLVDVWEHAAKDGGPRADGFMMQDGELYPRGVHDRYANQETAYREAGPGGDAGGLPERDGAGVIDTSTGEIPWADEVTQFTGSDEELGALIAWMQQQRLIDTSTGEIAWADEARSGMSDAQLAALADRLRSQGLIDTSTGEIVWASSSPGAPVGETAGILPYLEQQPLVADDTDGPSTLLELGGADGGAGGGPGAFHDVAVGVVGDFDSDGDVSGHDLAHDLPDIDI